MGPQGSAQREPSMEEILASIRRIIEDNDTGRKQPTEADAWQPDHENGQVIEVEAFRSELRGGSDLSADDFPSLSSANDAVAKHLETPGRPQREADGHAGGMRFDPADAKSDLTDFDGINALENVFDAAIKEAVEDDLGPASPVDVEATAGDMSAVKPAILSELAERKVAASFSELSEAFAVRSKKTFDDIAEEMMRPMLQDWLDNNLPLLVERLVREEIERVARGSR